MRHPVHPLKLARSGFGRCRTKRHGSVPSPRDAPELCNRFCPFENERAQGRPGARCTRGLVCDRQEKKEHTSIQVQRRASGLPCAMALRLIRDLPGERLFCLRCALGSRMPPRCIDASNATSGPHDFAVRFMRVRLAHSASTASHPCVRGDRERPSGRVRRPNHTPDFNSEKQKCF